MYTPVTTNKFDRDLRRASQRKKNLSKIKEICCLVLADIREKGLDCLSDREASGDFAEFRIYELAATINRFRALRVEQRLITKG